MRRIRWISREHAVETVKKIAEWLSRDERVKLVYLYGSTVDSKRPSVRDIDLAIYCEPPLSVAEGLSLEENIARDFAVPVQLVHLNKASIVLAHEIAETGICLYSASDVLARDFVVQAKARYWNFKPLIKVQRDSAYRRAEARIHGVTH